MQHDAGRMAAQPIARDVLAEKYLRPGEFGRQCVRRRVARALAAVEPAAQREEWERRFLWAMENGFIPAGRVLAAAGTDLPSTWLNTFVQPVGDAIDGQCDGRPGIYAALAQATQTLALGGGIGYDFTPLRPTGAPVRGSAACAAGPVAFMEVFDRACRTVLGAGARRGAQMAVLRCDHPDIGRFVAAKAEGALTSFNLSVGLTDEFVRAVERDGTLTLTHAAQPAGGLGQRDRHGRWVYGRLPARGLWRQIMRAAYEHAEPGVLFLDRINAENNLGYLERIAATNSCAEQPLPDYGCSCLGSINLTALVRAPFSAAAAFDWPRLARLVDVAVRMLDNVLDATPWPLPAHRDGIRNSHLLCVAPTGTISLAFADNVSNGIEPAFAWRYTRRKRTPAGEWTVYSVEDYAWRLYRHLGGDPDKLPASFVTALQVPAQAHLDMMAAVSPYIDASVSKTVNVPADCPYAEFETLYMNAWRAGLKGLATFRPNAVTGAVLECATSPGPVRVEQTSGLFVA
jgi:ribonucleoside-diphosphate reductase alpha chain